MASLGLLPVLARGARTRRRAENDGKPGLDGVKKWIEEKKAQGTAGVGGAVVGGMLGGPIGAVVGAQVASKMGPALDGALKALEGDLEDEEAASEPEAPASEPTKSNTPGPRRDQAPEPPAAEKEIPKATPPPPPPVAAEATKAAPAPGAAGGAAADTPAPAARGDNLFDELQALRKGVPEKEKKLELEVAELYAKAEEALKAGDEEAARKLLESRAAAQANLESLRAGQKRREAQQSEQLGSLEAQVQDLYAKAEKSLLAGNETDARRYLQEREEALKKLSELKQSREK